MLKKTADLMRERADAIARTMTMEQGKPLAEAKAEVLHSADTFEWFAEEGKRAYGQVIPQSNAAQAAHDHQAPGRRRRRDQPVELPDHAASPQDRPGARRRLHHRLQAREPDAAVAHRRLRVPDRRRAAAGRRQPRHRPGEEIADEFLENPVVRKISFTGSTEVGKQLMRAGRRPGEAASLELGGHAPFIVFPDADPEVVAKAAVIGKFRNNGQVCIARAGSSSTRTCEKKFTEAAVEVAKKLKIGNGLDEGVEVGPMFEKKAMDSTLGLIDDATGKGAKVLTGGKRSTGSTRATSSSRRS